ncbi:hypothetical protein PPTG_19597 [Phytophthora nicotianae INRA-310]|uniref:HAT C-terminal dimerisation domain-containing protein n=1 Tax=Phytophthora nicotianae (strain INRA-310) TaxID=761204 RepID=W2PC22_PHYN3|nr:hypothetical protein PPTG_19597 [Phytophthora nicotianae INRA-310]ETM98376.1 hypothetical protein PPTG_19597 [Phytophthora nicotianae INRA-310]
MVATVELVEPCLQEEFKGEKFGVTDGCEHSLAVFAATQKDIRFLTLSSFVEEKSMTADEHIRFLDMVLYQYKLEANNLIAIVCDNMETNKAISRRIDAPKIGWAAHRFNLAVKEALLKENGCKLKPVPMHELRWSGLHRMMKRYMQFHPYLHLFDRDREVDRYLPSDASQDDARRFPIVDFLPTPSEHCDIVDLLEDMNILEFSTRRLQEADLTLVTVRDIFDEVAVEFPELEGRLKMDTQIVESCDFEAGVVKIMKGQEHSLTSREKKSVSRLLCPPLESEADECPGRHITSETNSEPRPKRRRTTQEFQNAVTGRAVAREKSRSKYMDLSWIPATSVEVERLFSKMKCMLGYLRKSMSKKTLEVILFLRMNWDLVTNEITTKAVRNAREEDIVDEEECDVIE